MFGYYDEDLIGESTIGRDEYGLAPEDWEEQKSMMAEYLESDEYKLDQELYGD